MCLLWASKESCSAKLHLERAIRGGRTRHESLERQKCSQMKMYRNKSDRKPARRELSKASPEIMEIMRDAVRRVHTDGAGMVCTCTRGYTQE